VTRTARPPKITKSNSLALFAWLLQVWHFYSDGSSNLQELLTVPKGLNASTMFFKKTTFGTFFVHSLPVKGG
jgi:hypothetical protein